ncbi:MAG: hypothetical protein ACXWAT_00240 [Methylobacter sp.]
MENELLKAVSGRIRTALAFLDIGGIDEAINVLKQASSVLPDPEKNNIDASLQASKARRANV